MNKLKLGLGIFLSTALPVISIVSCSATTTPPPTGETSGSLDAEVKKFNTTIETTKKNLSASAALSSVMSESVTDKLKALQDLGPLPALSKEFKLEVKSGIVDQATGKSINFTLIITDLAKNTTKEANLIINGFSPSSNLEAFAAQFTTTQTKDTNMGSGKAVTSLIEANGNDAKLAVLKSLANIPDAGTDFLIEIKNVQFAPGNNRSIQISLAIKTVVQVSGTNSVDVNYTITGFAASGGAEQGQAVLYVKSQLLDDRQVLPGKANETAVEASKILISTEALNSYYALTELGDGAKYRWISTTVSGNSLVVKVGVRNKSESQGVPKDIVISGFKPATK